MPDGQPRVIGSAWSAEHIRGIDPQIVVVFDDRADYYVWFIAVPTWNIYFSLLVSED